MIGLIGLQLYGNANHHNIHVGKDGPASFTNIDKETLELCPREITLYMNCNK